MPKSLADLSRHTRVYVSAVIGVGSLVMAHAIYGVYHASIRSDWLILAALTLLTGSFSIKIPSVSARISVSEAFVFLSVLVFGPDVATVIVSLDTLILTTWFRGPNRSLHRAAFNIAAGAIAISI